MVMPRWNFVNQYPVLQREILTDEIADRKRVKHPLFQFVLVDVLRVGDEIEIASDALAINLDAKLR